MKTKVMLKRSATLSVHTKTSENTEIMQDFENIKRLQTTNWTDLYAKNITYVAHTRARMHERMHACSHTHTHTLVS